MDGLHVGQFAGVPSTPLGGIAPKTIDIQTQSLLDSPTVKARLVHYFENYCKDSSLTRDKMLEMVKKGEELERFLATKPSMKEMAKRAEHNGTDAAVSLMWLFTAKAAACNKLFTSGAYRQADGEGLRDFLILCGTAEHPAHGRISTHMNELKGETREVEFDGSQKKITADDPHWGLDIRNMQLPANTRTINFGLLPDGSLYIKMEKRGCPKWTSWDNIKEWWGHAGTYIQSKLKIKTSNLHEYKEKHLSEAAKEAFKEALKTLFKKDDSKKEKLSRNEKKEIEKLYKEGKKYGLSKMAEIMEGKVPSLEGQIEQNRREALRDSSKMFKEEFIQKPEGYIGDVKGEEVLIGRFGSSITIVEDSAP